MGNWLYAKPNQNFPGTMTWPDGTTEKGYLHGKNRIFKFVTVAEWQKKLAPRPTENRTMAKMVYDKLIKCGGKLKCGGTKRDGTRRLADTRPSLLTVTLASTLFCFACYLIYCWYRHRSKLHPETCRASETCTAPERDSIPDVDLELDMCLL